MAVYKSRRKDAAAQFVADARELRKATVRIARKFPASYKYVTTGPLLQLASEVYMNALKGNSIYVHKDMSERDYELRHRYLAAATASADALLGEITFCYELVDDGNNFFRNKEEYERTFQTWTTLANNALSNGFAPGFKNNLGPEQVAKCEAVPQTLKENLTLGDWPAMRGLHSLNHHSIRRPGRFLHGRGFTAALPRLHEQPLCSYFKPLRQTTQVREVMHPANRAPDRTLYGWDTALEAT